MIRPGFLLLCSSLFRRLCNLCSVSFRRICNPTVSTIRIFNPLTSFFRPARVCFERIANPYNTFRRIANHAETRGLNFCSVGFAIFRSVSFRRICNPTVSTIRIFNPLTSFFGLLTCALSGLQILNNTFRRIANHAETRGLNCKRRVIRSSGVCRIGANPVPEGGELCLTACVVTEGNGTCGKSKPP